MEMIPLYTRAGEFVVDVVVPPFTPPAEVLVWGVRFFARREDGKYCEAMAYFVPPQLHEAGESANVADPFGTPESGCL